jgi:hypothetical protein
MAAIERSYELHCVVPINEEGQAYTAEAVKRMIVARLRDFGIKVTDLRLTFELIDHTEVLNPPQEAATFHERGLPPDRNT